MTIAMPLLGAGTFRLKGEDAYNSVTMALNAGYRHIDTAQVYGNEQEVGTAIADSGIARDEIFLTTKIWMDKFGKDAFLPSIRQSLQDLQTDYIDLLLIHWPLKNEEVAMEDYLASLKEVKALGLAKHIGISNFTVAQMAQAVSILGADEIYTNQVEVHPYLQNRKVVDFCRQHGIIVTGYMPFAYGDVLKDETIIKIADKHDASPAQIVLAWMRQNEFVTIPSSTKQANIESNMKSDAVALNSDEMALIAELDRNHRKANPDFAPEWD
ncbi:2,5-didehydrogluconate reductase DkgB [Photobacterium sanctipauli]|uniref:2,5-didehydrogluconate reductase DkgB n=1 Tax=Photobacterium sanctipauli TaxID=1342794 RepID=A0A2T3NWU8_9GAMM|nr:2,5-didehydrogluconate reductase DkgB [Photobacterium sanctipauli]PSW20726.1 2,5-didehydrogluconate reductase DkgB [Photobacterium sanctipauli]